MKDNTSDVIHKEVVVIGNGPSGIALSYMLAGHHPFVTSDFHPDEMFSARLNTALDKNLVSEDLGYLSTGLEGRTTNPVSLLLDSLLHPCADIGYEMEPLVEWKKRNGCEIDHVVLGKGPPGGAWHTMDPQILTLSFGSWMALPGLPFHSRDSGEKRALACSVAQYYEQYVNAMNLSQYFHNGVVVTKVTHLNNNALAPKCNGEQKMPEIAHPRGAKIKNYSFSWRNNCMEIDDRKETETTKNKICSITDAINFIFSNGNKKLKNSRCCKRPREISLKHDLSPDRKIREYSDDTFDKEINDRYTPSDIVKLVSDRNNVLSSCKKAPQNHFHNKLAKDQGNCISETAKTFNCCSQVPFSDEISDQNSSYISRQCDYSTSDPTNLAQNQNVAQPNWLIEALDVKTGKSFTYTSKYLILANGASDIPNRIPVSNGKADPSWLLYDLRCLEDHLDKYVASNGFNCDPVLIVGAGLSAADAIITTRSRNIPVIHVFRNNSPGLNKRLPENMYPEYHKVHQMMKDGGSTYPLYTALAEYELTNIDESSHSVTLTSKSGNELKYRVSFAAVLIGSRPDLSFLPDDFNLGVNKNAPIDCKSNTIDIDKLTHSVNGYNNLYAVGPLAGDNFVRFIPGGALAVIADLFRKRF